MELALKIMGCWVLLSFTLGPCLTWLFFYGERQRNQEKDRRVPIGNPASPLRMPSLEVYDPTQYANAPPPNTTPSRRKQTPPGGQSTPSKPFAVIEYIPFFIVFTSSP
jgi:hypothetical protein